MHFYILGPLVSNCRDTNDNSGRSRSYRLPVAARGISYTTRGTRRSSENIVISVPVLLNGDDRSIHLENDEQIRSDGILQIQQRLERNITQVRNQLTRLDRPIASLNQYFVSVDANIRSISQYSVFVEQNVRTILRCLTSWSHCDHIDGHMRGFGHPCATIADIKNSIDFGNDTGADSD